MCVEYHWMIYLFFILSKGYGHTWLCRFSVSWPACHPCTSRLKAPFLAPEPAQSSLPPPAWPSSSSPSWAPPKLFGIPLPSSRRHTLTLEHLPYDITISHVHRTVSSSVGAFPPWFLCLQCAVPRQGGADLHQTLGRVCSLSECWCTDFFLFVFFLSHSVWVGNCIVLHGTW